MTYFLFISLFYLIGNSKSFTCINGYVPLDSLSCSSKLSKFPPNEQSNQYPPLMNCTFSLPVPTNKILSLTLNLNASAGDVLIITDGFDSFTLDSTSNEVTDYVFAVGVTLQLISSSTGHGSLIISWRCENLTSSSIVYEQPRPNDYNLIPMNQSATISNGGPNEEYALIFPYQANIDVNTPIFFFNGSTSLTGGYLGRYSTLSTAGKYLTDVTITIAINYVYSRDMNMENTLLLLKKQNEIKRYASYQFFVSSSDLNKFPEKIILDATAGPAAVIVHQSFSLMAPFSMVESFLKEIRIQNTSTTIDWYTETDGPPSQAVYSFHYNDVQNFQVINQLILGYMNTLVVEKGNVSLAPASVKAVGTMNIKSSSTAGLLACANYKAQCVNQAVNHFTNYSYYFDTLSNVNFTVLNCDEDCYFEVYNGAFSELENGDTLPLLAIRSFELHYKQELAGSCQIQFTVETYRHPPPISGAWTNLPSILITLLCNVQLLRLL